jgi:hypothetical protein
MVTKRPVRQGPMKSKLAKRQPKHKLLGGLKRIRTGC